MVQANEDRFVNASVEFNIKTLMPTYRLMWGTAGESQALAVAEGLGFDADIVKAASAIAEQSTFSSKPGDFLSKILQAFDGLERYSSPEPESRESSTLLLTCKQNSE